MVNDGFDDWNERIDEMNRPEFGTMPAVFGGEAAKSGRCQLAESLRRDGTNDENVDVRLSEIRTQSKTSNRLDNDVLKLFLCR